MRIMYNDQYTALIGTECGTCTCTHIKRIKDECMHRAHIII